MYRPVPVFLVQVVNFHRLALHYHEHPPPPPPLHRVPLFSLVLFVCLACCVFRAIQVPPYARAGLYRQLATLKDLVREFREDYVKNASLRPIIAAQMQQAGLYEDLPYRGPGGDGEVLTAEAAEELPAEGEVRFCVGTRFCRCCGWFVAVRGVCVCRCVGRR